MSALDDALSSFSQGTPAESKSTPALDAAVSSVKDAPNSPHEAVANLVGNVPQFSIPESPLSPMERGAFGWLKSPVHQKEYLEKKFGEGNVQLMKMDEGKAGYVAKSEDGKWRQIDPQGLSDIPADLLKGQVGQALSRITHFNLKNTLGGAAQFLGEHGLDSAGAAAGGAAGAAAGSALGPVGSLAGATIGGAVGAGAGSLFDAGVRQTLDLTKQVTGMDIPGAEKISGEDLHHQVMGSMLFGASQELAAPFLKAGLKGGAKVFGELLSRLGDTPQAKQAQSALIQGLSGMKEGLARAWVESPKEVASFIPNAIKDRQLNTDGLRQMQKSTINDFVDQAQNARSRLGQQYDMIDRKAGSAKFDAFKPDEQGKNAVQDSFKQLIDERYVDGKGQLMRPGNGDISRDTTGANGAAINRMVSDFNALSSKNGGASFKDLTIIDKNLENYLFGNNQVTDGNLRKILMNYRASINTVKSQGLHEVNPELANQLADLNSKYGPAKDLLGTLTTKSEDQRLDTFLKQVIRDDGSYNSELMSSVGHLLGIENPTKKILQMEVAKNAAPVFSGTGNVSVMGVKLPASPLLARGAMKGVSAYQDLASGINQNAVQPVKNALSPYISKMHDMFRALPDGAKQILIKSPEAISSLGSMISGAAISEKQDGSKLLQQSGAFQQQQQPQGQ